MSRLRMRRPATGTVLGGLALIVAVAGNAHAFSATQMIVRKGDIAPGAVTAKTLAKGSVHGKALAKGAVTAKALGQGSVTSSALANDAVTASAIAPGSVYGGALGAVEVRGAPIADSDSVPHNLEWTASERVTASCATGERVLSGGLVFGNPGNGAVSAIEAVPFNNGSSSGFAGRITSDSGGSANAEVQAYCLK